MSAERAQLPPRRVQISAHVVEQSVEGENRIVRLAKRDELAPVGAELYERRGAAEGAVRHLAVQEGERAVGRDVRRVAAVVRRGDLVRPVRPAFETAPARLRMDLGDERD